MVATASEVAQWMVDQIRASELEYQEALVQEIEDRFGSEWVYQNDNGNPAISKRVLTEFGKIHAGTIEWDRSERAWSVV